MENFLPLKQKQNKTQTISGLTRTNYLLIVQAHVNRNNDTGPLDLEKGAASEEGLPNPTLVHPTATLPFPFHETQCTGHADSRAREDTAPWCVNQQSEPEAGIYGLPEGHLSHCCSIKHKLRKRHMYIHVHAHIHPYTHVHTYMHTYMCSHINVAKTSVCIK